MRDEDKLSIGDSIIKLCDRGIRGKGYEIAIRPCGVGWFEIVRNEYAEDEKSEVKETVLGAGPEIDKALMMAVSCLGGG